MWVSKQEAAGLLGVSIDTIERRLKRGDLNGHQEARGNGWRWMVEVADNGAPAAPASAPAGAPAGEVQALQDLVAVLKDEVTTLTGQMEAKDRQLGELHVLLQQTQAALPAARDGRPWWRRLFSNAT